MTKLFIKFLQMKRISCEVRYVLFRIADNGRLQDPIQCRCQISATMGCGEKCNGRHGFYYRLILGIILTLNVRLGHISKVKDKLITGSDLFDNKPAHTVYHEYERNLKSRHSLP